MASGLKTCVQVEVVERVMAAKAATGKTYEQISKEIGLTNTYTAQLFLGQGEQLQM